MHDWPQRVETQKREDGSPTVNASTTDAISRPRESLRRVIGHHRARLGRYHACLWCYFARFWHYCARLWRYHARLRLYRARLSRASLRVITSIGGVNTHRDVRCCRECISRHKITRMKLLMQRPTRTVIP